MVEMASLGGALAGVVQGDAMAGLGGHLSNAGTHGAGADDADRSTGRQGGWLGHEGLLGGGESVAAKARRALLHKGVDAFAIVLAATGQALIVALEIELLVEAVIEAGM